MCERFVGRAAALCVLISLSLASPAMAGPFGYTQTNLASDVPNLAANTDPNLRNPWGMSYSATSPFWVSDQAATLATLYNAAGAPQPLVVATPPSPGPGATGQVFVGGQGFAMMNSGGSATFAFATLAGTIDAWNSGTSAVVQVSTPGAVYTGLAVANGQLYAANTSSNRIDVFSNSFAPTTTSGTFVDPNVPAGFTPYNIQNIGGLLYVEYANRGNPGGFIGVFDANGNFIRHLSDSHLDSPWGVTLAPAGFGDFAGDLLVGNFGNGMINAFNPLTGLYLGTVSDANGNPLVNFGLWAIGFRAPGSTFDPNALYFTAGINGEVDGLFGSISPTTVPEPATLGLVGLGALLLARRRRQTV